VSCCGALFEINPGWQTLPCAAVMTSNFIRVRSKAAAWCQTLPTACIKAAKSRLPHLHVSKFGQTAMGSMTPAFVA